MKFIRNLFYLSAMNLFIPALNAFSLINTSSTVSFNNQDLNEIRILLAYLFIGSGIAICGCGLTFTGLRKLFTNHDNTVHSGALALIGGSIIILGLQVALGNIAL